MSVTPEHHTIPIAINRDDNIEQAPHEHNESIYAELNNYLDILSDILLAAHKLLDAFSLTANEHRQLRLYSLVIENAARQSNDFNDYNDRELRDLLPKYRRKVTIVSEAAESIYTDIRWAIIYALGSILGIAVFINRLIVIESIQSECKNSTLSCVGQASVTAFSAPAGLISSILLISILFNTPIQYRQEIRALCADLQPTILHTQHQTMPSETCVAFLQDGGITDGKYLGINPFL